jgi:hypothetical protein
MIESLFDGFGSLFASAPGLLLLATLAAAIPLVWDWRVAIGALVLLQVATAMMLAHLHGTPALLTVGQLVAGLVAGGVLLLAQLARGADLTRRQPASWLLRLLAVGFVVLAWWFADPGIGLPMMSQPEVDILVWIAICALIVTTLSTDPLFVAVAMLLWLLPGYAIAIVLLPTSGMPALLGIAEILVALACSYLLLTQPRQQPFTAMRRIVVPLPLPATRQARPYRLPALRPRAAVAPTGAQRAAPTTSRAASSGLTAPPKVNSAPTANSQRQPDAPSQSEPTVTAP